jgi:hypothetical protein
MADATIRIKLGLLEVDYQGDDSFLKKDLLEKVRELLELQKQHVVAPDASDSREANGGAAVGHYDHSTDTIANLISGESGADLLIAAAAHMHFAKGKAKFTRKELLTEMRAATRHYSKLYKQHVELLEDPDH